MLPSMSPTVVSVINYKGGVGKTTLTANIGAEMAYRGRKVLLIDLDPQSSLTFCFYPAREWESTLADDCTILQWFGSVLSNGPNESLFKYVLTPPSVNEVIGANGSGRLDLVASHLGLIDVDLDFAADLGGSRFQHGSPRYLPLHRALADTLEEDAFAEYDAILIDCAPNFTMVTRTGIVASDHILVPAKPDYLSTLGIDYLRRKLSELITEYNRVASAGGAQINPTILGIVFTMVQYGPNGPINALKNYIAYADALEVPAFREMVRESKTLFAAAGEHGVPAALLPNANPTVQYELQQLTSAFLAKIRT